MGHLIASFPGGKLIIHCFPLIGK